MILVARTEPGRGFRSRDTTRVSYKFRPRKDRSVIPNTTEVANVIMFASTLSIRVLNRVESFSRSVHEG